MLYLTRIADARTSLALSDGTACKTSADRSEAPRINRYVSRRVRLLAMMLLAGELSYRRLVRGEEEEPGREDRRA